METHEEEKESMQVMYLRREIAMLNDEIRQLNAMLKARDAWKDVEWEKMPEWVNYAVPRLLTQPYAGPIWYWYGYEKEPHIGRHGWEWSGGKHGPIDEYKQPVRLDLIPGFQLTRLIRQRPFDQRKGDDDAVAQETASGSQQGDL